MWNKVTTRVNCRGRTQSHIGMMVTTKGELRMKGAYPILGSLSFHRRPFPLKLCCRPDVKPRACATIARKNRTRPPIWLAPAPKVLCEGPNLGQRMGTKASYSTLQAATAAAIGWSSSTPWLVALVLALFMGMCVLVVAVLLACLACCRAVVLVCREAAAASRDLSRCADDITRACEAVCVTMSVVSADLQQIERAAVEAGVLAGKLSDLPLRALASLAPGAVAAVKKENVDSGFVARIGEAVPGKRAGNSWGATAGHDDVPKLRFDRANTFAAGEYVAVPRTSGQYTWGVVDQAPDNMLDNMATEATLDEAQMSPGEMSRSKLKRVLTPLKQAQQDARRRMDDALKVMQETEYDVVVEVDPASGEYSYKRLPAGALGKATSPFMVGGPSCALQPDGDMHDDNTSGDKSLSKILSEG